MSEVSIVLFTRDLRVHDHPALSAARRAAGRSGEVVPLFVLDPAILEVSGANRRAFLAESLADLDTALRQRGGRLVVRRGDTVDEVIRLVAETGARSVHVTVDVSRTAQDRQARLQDASAARGVTIDLAPGVTVVPPGDLTPTGGDHYKVFTPYYRTWVDAPWRDPAPTPRSIRVPDDVRGDPVPGVHDLASTGTSPRRARGGEVEGRKRFRQWLRSGIDDYDDQSDQLASSGTSTLSPYLRFGCVSPLEVAREARDRGVDGFVRQLCWREFHSQVTWAFPDISRRDYHPRGRTWKGDGPEFVAWRDGHTGVELVDAAMAQLYEAGWVHNRARMTAASYLTKTLGVHWKLGADLYMEWLTDGDVANNYGNWQWTAGTGNDTRPNRELNPDRQAKRFDPAAAYRFRWLHDVEP